MALPPLLLCQTLSISPAMYSSLPTGRGFAGVEQAPKRWGDEQLFSLKAGRRTEYQDLTLAHRSGWRKLTVVVHNSSQPSRSRSASQGPGEEQSKVIFVAHDSSTGSKSQTATVASHQPFPPPQPQIGSPLLWIGVGVGISIFFTWAARRVQSYAMQQALKSMMQQTGQSGNPFAMGPGSPFAGPGSPFAGMPPGTFPFPLPAPPSSSVASATTVDVTANAISQPQPDAQVTVERPPEIKRSAFTDVNINSLEEQEPSAWKGPPEISQQQATSEKVPSKETEVVDGAASFTDPSNFGGQANTSKNGNSQSFINMDMLEKMLDDPQIQKMVFLHLPKEWRDPDTFKSMIKIPTIRQQLQEALNNMGGADGLDMLKYMNSDVVKQQFDQIGLSPEEVVGKILANPDIAASLQNSKVVEAIMDCSQNPLNITKYQNDKEVMDALFKIAELFPGATGPPY